MVNNTGLSSLMLRFSNILHYRLLSFSAYLCYSLTIWVEILSDRCLTQLVGFTFFALSLQQKWWFYFFLGQTEKEAYVALPLKTKIVVVFLSEKKNLTFPVLGKGYDSYWFVLGMCVFLC